jgi:hypothetical protein
VIRFRWGTALTATLRSGASTYLRDGKRRIHVLQIPHDGRVEVTITTG